MRERKTKRAARSATRKVVIALEVLVMLIMIMGAYGYSKINRINTVNLDTADIVVNDEIDAEILSGFTNIALFGLDSRDNELSGGTNSDTMIVVSINNETGLINMASLYRDTYMDLGNGNYAKANSAYAIGGPAQALSMMNKSMDLNLDKYVATNFKALAVAIDCLGGLDVEMTGEEVVWMNGYVIETAIASDMLAQAKDDEEIYDGVHHLDGLQATAFCRIRYTVGDDYKRTERQRYILSLIFEKAKTMDVVTLNSIADQVFPLINTNMTLGEMLKIGMNIMKFNMNTSIGLPENKRTGNVGNKGDCVIPTNWAADVTNLHYVMFNDMAYTPSSVVQEISDYTANIETTDGTTTTDNSYDSGTSYVDYGGSDYEEYDDDYDYDDYDDSDSESYSDEE